MKLRSVLFATALAAAWATVAAFALQGCGAAPDPGTGAGGGAAYVQRISAAELDNWRGVHYDGVVLDVRTPVEWNTGLVPLPNSLFISAPEMTSRMTELEPYRNKPVLVIDKAGESSVAAAQLLVNRGFRDVTALDGGLTAYRAIYPESR